MKALENLKELKRFIGKIKWHSRFIKYLAHVACPLYQLTMKATAFKWTKECQRSFQLLKIMLTWTPIMVALDWNKKFHVYTDTLDKALGATLMLVTEQGHMQPIYYASKALTRIERHFNTIEWKALVIVYTITKFRHYLLGSPFILHVDHQALIYTVNKKQH